MPFQEVKTRSGNGSLYFSAVRGGFFWPKAPQHASACEGCGGGRAMNACRRQRCLALAKRRSAPPKALLSVYAGVRARPGRRSTGKTRSSTCSEASTGVAPRKICRTSIIARLNMLIKHFRNDCHKELIKQPLYARSRKNYSGPYTSFGSKTFSDTVRPSMVR